MTAREAADNEPFVAELLFTDGLPAMDDEVERFREFLDHVSAEDFETKPGETGPEQ